jgi:hypothetical protein
MEDRGELSSPPAEAESVLYADLSVGKVRDLASHLSTDFVVACIVDDLLEGRAERLTQRSKTCL